jgi:hypothetical protein
MGVHVWQRHYGVYPEEKKASFIIQYTIKHSLHIFQLSSFS